MKPWNWRRLLLVLGLSHFAALDRRSRDELARARIADDFRRKLVEEAYAKHRVAAHNVREVAGRVERHNSNVVEPVVRGALETLSSHRR